LIWRRSGGGPRKNPRRLVHLSKKVSSEKTIMKTCLGSRNTQHQGVIESGLSMGPRLKGNAAGEITKRQRISPQKHEEKKKDRLTSAYGMVRKSSLASDAVKPDLRDKTYAVGEKKNICLRTRAQRGQGRKNVWDFSHLKTLGNGISPKKEKSRGIFTGLDKEGRAFITRGEIVKS